MVILFPFVMEFDLNCILFKKYIDAMVLSFAISWSIKMKDWNFMEFDLLHVFLGGGEGIIRMTIPS